MPLKKDAASIGAVINSDFQQAFFKYQINSLSN
jgi:hypothetical protein